MSGENAAAVLTKSSGSVYVERQGTRISLAEGDSIRSTDTVITDGGATAEVRFADGATASLSPGTTLEVKDFAFGPDVQPSFILNLAQGTMRSVSGEVVKQNPDAFKIVTPQATVGIRGTELFTAVTPEGAEVHAVLHIGKGHIVTITSHDGRSVVMDTALQAVNMSDGEHGSLVKQTFQLNEMHNVIRSIAPSQVQNPIQPDGPEGEAQPGQSETPQAAPQSTTSSVVVITYETETATAAQTTAPGDVNTLISLVEQLQGALADAGFSVVLAGDAATDSLSLSQQADSAVAELITNTVTQVITTPGASTPQQPEVPQQPGQPPVPPDPDAGLVRVPDIDEVTGSVVAGTDETPDTDLSVTVTGNVGAGAHFASNVLNASGPQETGSDRITVQGTVAGNLYGDVQFVSGLNSGETLTFGTDRITVGSVGSAGTIYGDASAIAGSGTVHYGNDIITVTGNMAGTIIGDVGISSAPNVYGDDTITVNGSMTGGAIYGDAENAASSGGDDIITIKGNMTGGVIHGDSSTAATGGGNDTITVTGSMSGGTIHGGAGTDTINVSTALSGATINGGAGNDTINVATVLAGATINGDDGNDIIMVNQATLNSGQTASINGGVGADTITVGNISSATGTKGTLNINLGPLGDGGDGADTLTLSSLNTLNGNINIANYDVAGGDKIVGLGDLTAVSKTFAGGIFTMHSNNGSIISIQGNWDSSMTAEQVYQQLMSAGSSATP